MIRVTSRGRQAGAVVHVVRFALDVCSEGHDEFFFFEGVYYSVGILISCYFGNCEFGIGDGAKKMVLTGTGRH